MTMARANHFGLPLPRTTRLMRGRLLFCAHCGKQQPDQAAGFCTFCGKALLKPQESPTASVQEKAGQVLEGAGKVAGQAASKFENFAATSEVLGKIPGRSVTLLGLGAMAVAIALGFVGSWPGIGWLWAGIMLLGGALIAVQELRRHGAEVPQLPAVPAALSHPLIQFGFVALVIAQAIRLAGVGVTPLLWIAAALLLTYDGYKKAKLRFPEFDLKNSKAGIRKVVLIACIAALAISFMQWSSTDGYFSGGYSYNYGYENGGIAGEYGYGYEYEAAQYFWPGWSFSGRALRLSPVGLSAVLLLIGWTMFSRPPVNSVWWNRAPLVLAGVTAAWWLFAGGHQFWGFVFLILVIAAGALAYRSTRSAAPVSQRAPS